MNEGVGCRKPFVGLIRLVWIPALCLGAVTLILYGAVRLLYPLRYQRLVSYYADLYDVPREIVYAIIRTESQFDPDAVSRTGARGLMQLMPETYRAVATAIGRVPDECLAFDPGMNIQCGVYLLSQLYRKYGVWETAFAAYNAGETAVDRWLSDDRYSHNGHLIKIPYGETERYVKRVRHAVNVYRKRMKTT